MIEALVFVHKKGIIHRWVLTDILMHYVIYPVLHVSFSSPGLPTHTELPYFVTDLRPKSPNTENLDGEEKNLKIKKILFRGDTTPLKPFIDIKILSSHLKCLNLTSEVEKIVIFS